MAYKFTDVLIITVVDKKGNENIPNLKMGGQWMPAIMWDEGKFKSLYPAFKRILDAHGLYFKVSKLFNRIDVTEEYRRINTRIKKNNPINSIWGLTKREGQIIEFVLKGLTSRAISVMLSLSIRTVQNHRANIMKKLNVHNTVEMIALYSTKL